MNYLTEIKEFYNWLEENPSGSSVIALWHALMYTNNKLMWKESFTVPIKILESRTGLKKNAIYKARNKLKQHGLIDFKERGGNQCSVYTIIPFALRQNSCVVLNNANGNTKETQLAAYQGAQSEAGGQTLNKQYQTKQNKNNNTEKKSKFYNYTDTVQSDYADLDEKLLNMMLEGNF